MHHTFSIKESFAFGWRKTKQHSGLLLRTMLILFALQVAQALVGTVLEHQPIGILASVAIFAAEAVVGIGFTLITLKIAKGVRATYADITPPARLVWEYILASLLAGLMIAAGLLLFIVPGVYLAVRFSMVRFAVLEGEGVIGSIKKSGTLTEGVKWRLLGFLLVCGLLNAAGIIFFAIGLLVSVPVTAVAYAHVYQKLHARHHGEHAEGEHHTHHSHTA